MLGPKLLVQNGIFGQVGHGGKKSIWGVSFTKIPGQKGYDFF
jgi:hypothetical protein